MQWFIPLRMTIREQKHLKALIWPSGYDKRITVPVLFDKKTRKIVNNESSEIIRIFNCAFNAFCGTDEQRKLNFYPENLRPAIDAVNEWVYP